MKSIKTYIQFINEELKHLPPPSEEETFEIDPFKRIEYVNSGKLDKKFYPSDDELNNELLKLKPQDAFDKSVQINYLNGIKKAIDRGADINIKINFGWTALISASYFGHLDVVKFLVKNGADVNIKSNDGDTALIKASSKGYLDVVKFLVENGADINIKNNVDRTALIKASSKGYLDVVKYLKSNMK